MITTEAPIGEVINFINKNDSLYEEKPWIKKVKNLLDLIVVRTKKSGVSEALAYLEDDLFEIRLLIMSEQGTFESISRDVKNSIRQRIRAQFTKTTHHQALELAFLNAIDIHGKIFTTSAQLVSENPNGGIEKLPQISYKDFTRLLKSLPGKEAEIMLSLLSTSLLLDYALLVAELIFDNKLKLKKSEVETLTATIKNAIEEYAVLANQLGTWSPSDEDESPWMRNIKIRIALQETEVRAAHLTLDEAIQMLDK